MAITICILHPHGGGIKNGKKMLASPKFYIRKTT